ncbi:MAG: ABC transporter permease [Salinivirgaceae bacterium]|nr:ABC transporter permease [Salinivirgaceae bacterium]MDY0280247.1 ABC transporter permease [Salinivirgaceae bacterium]
MRQLIIFVKKEFLHVFRDWKAMLLLIGMPVAQILLFGFALTNEISNAEIVICDLSKDEATQRIIEKFDASKTFIVRNSITNINQVDEAFKDGKTKLVIVFPPNFNYDLQHQKRAQIQIVADASDPNTATTLTNFASQIIMSYQKELLNNQSIPFEITTDMQMVYNPDLKGSTNFVPGVMALVLLLVCVLMTSVSIVKEKELGTMEILLVSPMNPLLVILSKAIPYLVLSIVNLIIILLLSVFMLDLPIKGSLILLFAESILLIITALSIGLMISNITASQQTAMLIALAGMMLPTLLFSGFMFPIENMPVALQVISNIVPSKWYYIIVKNIMIKGLGFTAIWKETLILLGMTLFFLTVSLKKFKTRLS